MMFPHSLSINGSNFTKMADVESDGMVMGATYYNEDTGHYNNFYNPAWVSKFGKETHQDSFMVLVDDTLEVWLND